MTSAVSPEIEARYRALMQECQQLTTKIAELETDRNEHKYVSSFVLGFLLPCCVVMCFPRLHSSPPILFRLVEETLEPLDPDRRAFRLVGGVLVERTVKEVLPSVKQNRENLDQVISTMEQRLSVKQKEAAEFKMKHSLVTET